MKNRLIIVFLFLGSVLYAQDFNEKLVIPLSDPNSPGKLEVGLVR